MNVSQRKPISPRTEALESILVERSPVDPKAMGTYTITYTAMCESDIRAAQRGQGRGPNLGGPGS